jgi:hypothetical protein
MGTTEKKSLKSSLLTWGQTAKDAAFYRVVEGVFAGMLSCSPIVDSFSSWFMAGAAGTAALMIANLEAVSEVLTPPTTRTSLLLLAGSIFMGAVQKYVALKVRVFISVSQAVTKEIAGPLDELSKAEDEISEMAEEHEIEVPDLELDIERMVMEVETAFPWYLTWWGNRYVTKSFSDRLAGHRRYIRAAFRQGLYALVQFVLLIILLIFVALRLGVQNGV